MGLLKFYTDANIDKQVAIQLRQRGIIVIRCQDVGMDNASDEQHLMYATQHELSIISKDADFRTLHFHWMAENKTHFGIFLCSNCQIDAVGKIVTECTTYFQLAETDQDIINKLVEF